MSFGSWIHNTFAPENDRLEHQFSYLQSEATSNYNDLKSAVDKFNAALKPAHQLVIQNIAIFAVITNWTFTTQQQLALENTQLSVSQSKLVRDLSDAMDLYGVYFVAGFLRAAFAYLTSTGTAAAGVGAGTGGVGVAGAECTESLEGFADVAAASGDASGAAAATEIGADAGVEGAAEGGAAATELAAGAASGLETLGVGLAIGAAIAGVTEMFTIGHADTELQKNCNKLNTYIDKISTAQWHVNAEQKALNVTVQIAIDRFNKILKEVATAWPGLGMPIVTYVGTNVSAATAAQKEFVDKTASLIGAMGAVQNFLKATPGLAQDPKQLSEDVQMGHSGIPSDQIKAAIDLVIHMPGLLKPAPSQN